MPINVLCGFVVGFRFLMELYVPTGCYGFAKDFRLVVDLSYSVFVVPQIRDDYAPQRAEHASLPGRTAVSATEPLQLRAPYYGTVFHRT